MQNKTVVIGVGLSAKDHLIELIQDKIGENVVIVSPQEGRELKFPESEPFVIKNIHPPLLSIPGEKQFICNGRHQYREVKNKVPDGDGVFIKVEWVCQCGRKIND